MVVHRVVVNLVWWCIGCGGALGTTASGGGASGVVVHWM